MTDPGSPVLEARAISKSFAQTRALVDAHLSLRPGVTHALLGANGAGKSTLSRVISGHVRRDSGEIVYGGQPLNVRSPRLLKHVLPELQGQITRRHQVNRHAQKLFQFGLQSAQVKQCSAR